MEVVTPQLRAFSLTKENAIELVHKHFPEYVGQRLRLVEIDNRHSHATFRTYFIEISSINQLLICFLTISEPNTEAAGLNGKLYQTNSLSMIHHLYNLVRERTESPVQVHTLDTSLSLIPYHYLLSPLLPLKNGHILLSLAQARKGNLLSIREDAMLDLRIGMHMGQVHSNIQNDWFGRPQLPGPNAPVSIPLMPPVEDGAYSWQETFVNLFEDVLSRVEESIIARGEQEKYKIPSEDIHRCLSRAIGFFLFDDVEVPSLITLTGNLDDVFVSLLPPSQGTAESTQDPEIRYIVPNLSHALWGDPLLEHIFMPPGPSAAVKEGYAGGGGGPIMVFPRQKTKRLWYTLFSALIILLEEGDAEDSWNVEMKESGKEGRVVMAWRTVEECVEALRDAPCY